MSNLERLFFSKDSIDNEGTVFLVDRLLHVDQALKCGIASRDGKIYFLLQENGTNFRIKWRSIADKKNQGFEKTDSKEKTPLFNAKNPNPSEKGIKKILVTEGEFDCVALCQLGATYCVSIPNGASSALSAFKNHGEFFQQFDEIYIAFDMDLPGQKAALEVKSLIPIRKWRRINFPQGSKDANEWLIKESPCEKGLLDLMDRAEKFTCEQIVPISALDDKIYSEIEYGVSTGWKTLDSLIGGIRKGELTVVTADTGAGKTTFCLNLMINLAMQKYPVWINSYEMKHEIIFRKICSAFLKKNMKVNDFDILDIAKVKGIMQNVPIHLNPSKSKADIESLRKQFELCSYVHGINYVLLDHLDFIQSNSKKPTAHERVDETMIELHKLAIEFNIHVVLVVHPKQSADSKGAVDMSQLKGSSSIKQYADNILILQRMSRVNDDSNDRRAKISLNKNRLFGNESSIFLTYWKESDSFYEND